MKLVLKPRIVRDRIGMGSIIDVNTGERRYNAAFVSRLIRDMAGHILGVVCWVDTGEGHLELVCTEDEIMKVVV